MAGRCRRRPVCREVRRRGWSGWDRSFSGGRRRATVRLGPRQVRPLILRAGWAGFAVKSGQFLRFEAPSPGDLLAGIGTGEQGTLMRAAWKWVIGFAAAGAALVGYIAIAGSTGFCPGCKVLVDRVMGRGEGSQAPARPAAITDLVAFTLDGKPVEFSNYVGKPIIVEFWATWCAPCIRQREIIHEMGSALSRRASVISLSVERDPAVVLKFLETHQMTPVEVMATPETQRALGVDAVPV